MCRFRKNFLYSPKIIIVYLIILIIFFSTSCGSEEKNNKSQKDIIPEQITNISITIPPTATVYESGSNFNPEGMVVTATYNTGKTETITDYLVLDGDKLKKDTTEVTIAYQGMTVRQPIEVKPAELQVMISVKRTGNIISGIGKMSVFIDDEEVFKVNNNSTESVNIILTEGVHTIQTKGQGDKSKKIEFNVITDNEKNEFYFTSEISNIYGIKLEAI